MKAFLIFVTVVFFGGLCWWAFGGLSGNRSQAAVKLTPDHIHVFDSVASLKKRYPFVDQEFVGSSFNRLPWKPKGNGGIYAAQQLGPTGDDDNNFRKPSGFEYFIRIKFVPVKPGVAIDYARLSELNKVREAHGKRSFDPGVLDNIHLYTLKLEIQTGMEAQEARPDVWAYNKAADQWKGFFVELGENLAAKMAPDPTDPHRFEFNGSTFQFNQDFSEISSTGKMKSSLTRVDKLPSLRDLSGYHEATLKLAATTASNPEFLFRDYSRNAMLMKRVPIYLKPDGKGMVGKALINGETYPLNGFKDTSGTLKLFTTMKLYDAVRDDAFLQWNPGRAVISVLPYQSNIAVANYITYQTVSLEKANLKGKEAEMAANYDSLGSVPETIQNVPQVWNYYSPAPQPIITAVDAAKDPGWSQIFNLNARGPSILSSLPDASGGPLSNQSARVIGRSTSRSVEPTARQAKAAGGTQAEAKHTPTEQELEQQMQEAYRKRRRIP